MHLKVVDFLAVLGRVEAVVLVLLESEEVLDKGDDLVLGEAELVLPAGALLDLDQVFD